MIPMILAGGKGERFWPLSRRQHPKQFLCLDGSDRSLLQGTADRLLAVAGGWDRLWVVTAAHLAEGVRSQLPELPEANLLVEPEGRDTAPAVAWATLAASERYGQETVVGFFPADHWIADRPTFVSTLEAAAQLATEQGAIATLGITPTYPATGYGYIEQGDRLGEFQGLPGYRVARFAEKPDEATAAEFLASGRFSWNSGMFVFQAATMLAELRDRAPDIFNPIATEGVAAYANLPKLSIDYAVMEKTERACVLPVNFGWDDLGDWNAVERLLKQDADNLVIGHHLGLDTHGAIVHTGTTDELVVTLGIEDVTIVRDGRVTLVVHKSRTQDIKKVVQLLQQHPEYQDLL